MKPLTSLATALLLFAGAARADVGVPLEPNNGSGTAARRPIYLGVILDGPDPIGSLAWVQSGSGHGLPVNPTGYENGDGAPAAAADAATGTDVVAWGRRDGSAYEVVFSVLGAESWEPPVVVAVGGALDPRPAVAIAADGSLWFAYTVGEGTAAAAVVRKLDPDLTTWHPPVVVSEPGDAVTTAHLVLHDGLPHVAYARRETTGGATVVLATLDTGVVDRRVVATTANPGAVRPEAHSLSGVLWVDWVDFEPYPGSGELAWSRMDAEGDFLPPSYVAFDGFESKWLARPGIRLLAIAP